MQTTKNLVILEGNLGEAPKLNRTTNNVSVCNFTMATNEFYRDREGKRQKRVEWHKITCWGALAEQCAKALSTGREIRLIGKLVSKTYTDKQGVERTNVEIHPSTVEFGRYPNRDYDDDGDEFGEDPSDLTEDAI